MKLIAAAVLALALSPSMLHAQFLGEGPRDQFRDTSVLKPPAGAKVAVIVFEDLGCPGCAYAHPIELETSDKTRVPILRYDFPIAGHVWTFQGAVCARYLQDKVNPKLAEQYRSDVFAAQRNIASRDDLQRFNESWFPKHGQKMPFVIDPDGSLTKKVQADYDLGRRLNITQTPTVVVVSDHKYQVVCGTPEATDPTQLLPVVEAAVAETKSVKPVARRQ